LSLPTPRYWSGHARGNRPTDHHNVRLLDLISQAIVFLNFCQAICRFYFFKECYRREKVRLGASLEKSGYGALPAGLEH
jgi:hypothetical protein